MTDSDLLSLDTPSKDLTKKKEEYHVHHSMVNHKEFEFQTLQQMKLSRRNIFAAQRDARKYLFNSKDYKVSRYRMILKCAQIIRSHIGRFMATILTDEDECHHTGHSHEDVREVSLLFKEKHFGAEKWTVDVPVTGFASMMPFFSF